MKQTPRVAILILNWNGHEDTLACLGSLQRLTYPDYEIVVIDNASTDGSVEIIRSAYPQAALIETGANLGFVGGNNVGLEYAQKSGADYALLLNNDTEVAPDFLNYLVEALESDPQAGIAGPTIYYFSQPDVIWSAGGQVDFRQGSTRMLGMGEKGLGQAGQAPCKVDFVTGCALLIKMSVVVKIGMLDPRFFAYFEETEWCVRAGRRGYKSLYVPQSKIWHKISPERREASPAVQYYMTRNRLLFLKLTQAGPRPWINTLLIEYGKRLVSWTIKPRWRSKRPQLKAMQRGIWDYFAGKFGKAEV